MRSDGAEILLQEAAGAMLAAPNAAARFGRLCEALAAFGIDQVNYGYFDPAAAAHADADVHFLSTMRSEWLDYYADRKLHLTDPLVETVRTGHLLPYRWSEERSRLLEDPAQRSTALETAEAGIRSALCAPLATAFRPHVPVAGMTLGSTLTEAELARSTAGLLPQLITLVHLFHDSAIGNLTRQRLGIVELSPRECDVLTLIATGARQGQVADRLGISISAVEQYLSKARRKLRARTLHEAVARAVQFQAIRL